MESDHYFIVADSGQREEYTTGMRRDTEEGKVDWTFLFDGPMAKRYAEHLRKGAAKYGRNNWMLAATREEYDRFARSLLRHVVSYLEGDTTEDHAAAIWFNVNARENCANQMGEQDGE